MNASYFRELIDRLGTTYVVLLGMLLGAGVIFLLKWALRKDDGDEHSRHGGPGSE